VSDHFTREVIETVERIKPLLAGKFPPVQGAALATLTAMWITAHRELDASEAEQRELWQHLLRMHWDKVQELIDVEKTGDGG